MFSIALWEDGIKTSLLTGDKVHIVFEKWDDDSSVDISVERNGACLLLGESKLTGAPFMFRGAVDAKHFTAFIRQIMGLNGVKIASESSKEGKTIFTIG